MYKVRSEMRYEMEIPITGASTIKKRGGSTLSRRTTSTPAYAIAAPTNPPIKVCEELDGIPYHQVMRFHMIEAINPERITIRLIPSGFTDLDTVSATCNSKIQ